MSRKKGHGLDNLVFALGKVSVIVGRICSFGMGKIKMKSVEAWLLFFSLGTFLVSGFFLFHPWQYFAFVVFSIVLLLVILGFKDFSQHQRFQKAIERSGLKAATGEKPLIRAIIPKGEGRWRVIVETFGVGLGKFEGQRDSLTTGFKQSIERIRLARDKGKVEIDLYAGELPPLVNFSDLYAHIKKPYSFVIGEALDGPVVQEIRSLPHLLISGATGGGKSVFFRSTMLSLLKSSPHLQLYLLDLKRGVEVREFAELPNVKTAKDEGEATAILSSLVGEMNRRYKILEKEGLKCIEPKRDKLDLIVVGIDEAAALFGKKSNEKALIHVGKLARLARAAGIHLVPSTQKPVKEAISTETLDNLPGRMTFRMISSAASNVAMGGNFAKKLPAIKGRAVWTNGSEHKEVQAPWLDDKTMEEELKNLKSEFEKGVRKNFQKMLGLEEEIDVEEMTKGGNG